MLIKQPIYDLVKIEIAKFIEDYKINNYAKKEFKKSDFYDVEKEITLELADKNINYELRKENNLIIIETK